MLHLSWIDRLLDNLRTIFVDLYRDQLKKPHTSVVECEFDSYFDQQIRQLEGTAENNVQVSDGLTDNDITPPSSSDAGVDEPPPPIPNLLRGKSNGWLMEETHEYC